MSKKERIEFVMVPGNHDMCDNSFCAFDEFNKKYCKDVIGIFETDSCCVKSIETLTSFWLIQHIIKTTIMEK